VTNILDTDGGSIRYYIHQLGNPQNPTFALLIRPAPHKLNEVQIKWNQGKKKSQQEPANKPFNSPKLNKGRSISIPIAASSQLSSHMHDGVHSGHRSRHTPDRLLLSLVSWWRRRRDDGLCRAPVGTEVNDPSLGGEDGGAKADVIVVGAGVAGGAMSYALASVGTRKYNNFFFPKENISIV
jgi:hypothetical protein